MTDLISKMFSGCTDAITGLNSGIKTGFLNLIYVDPAATTKELSGIVEFAFIFGGVTLAIGIVWGTFRFIRSKTHH